MNRLYTIIRNIWVVIIVVGIFLYLNSDIKIGEIKLREIDKTFNIITELFVQGIDFNSLTNMDVLVGLYFLPSILSVLNWKKSLLNKIGIILLNLFLGWTVYFWLKLLFNSWSSSSMFGYTNNSNSYSKTDNYNEERRSIQKVEKVHIQYQLDSGVWSNYTTVYANDNAIAQAMKLARKGMTTKPGVTGKIRAKGVNSGAIYDLG